MTAVARKSVVLTGLGSLMLMGIAALHASGYVFVAQGIAESDLAPFFKDVLPILFLYPSAVLPGVALFAILAVTRSGGARFTLTAVALFVFAHAFLGFALGGWIPGGVLTLATALFAAGAGSLERAR